MLLGPIRDPLSLPHVQKLLNKCFYVWIAEEFTQSSYSQLFTCVLQPGDLMDSQHLPLNCYLLSSNATHEPSYAEPGSHQALMDTYANTPNLFL